MRVRSVSQPSQPATLAVANITCEGRREEGACKGMGRGKLVPLTARSSALRPVMLLAMLFHTPLLDQTYPHLPTLTHTYPHVPGGEPMSLDTVCLSMNSDMSRRTIASSLPK